jgi:hypothetical protein
MSFRPDTSASIGSAEGMALSERDSGLGVDLDDAIIGAPARRLLDLAEMPEVQEVLPRLDGLFVDGFFHAPDGSGGDVLVLAHAFLERGAAGREA